MMIDSAFHSIRLESIVAILPACINYLMVWSNSWTHYDFIIWLQFYLIFFYIFENCPKWNRWRFVLDCGFGMPQPLPSHLKWKTQNKIKWNARRKKKRCGSTEQSAQHEIAFWYGPECKNH